MTKVRIFREDPNSFNTSSQFVSTAETSLEVAMIFEDYKKGRTTIEEAKQEMDQLSNSTSNCKITVPFSVYLNVYENHASIIFMQADLLNRSGANVEESRALAEMEFGLRVFFCKNSFQVVNRMPIRRIDLFTRDGQEYSIEMSGDFLKPGTYTMFKCYEVIGISDFDIEWAYLMAAKEWYDMAVNNCLSYSKRIIREMHKQVMDEDLDKSELKKLDKLYISLPGEACFESFPTGISSIMAPRLQPFFIIILLFFFFAVYIELRLRYQQT